MRLFVVARFLGRLRKKQKPKTIITEDIPNENRSSVTLLKHKRNGSYLLQQECRHPSLGLATMFGEPIYIAKEDFEDVVCRLVSKALREYPTNDYYSQEYPINRNSKITKTMGNYHFLLIHLKGEELSITPMRKAYGGYASADTKITMDYDEFDATFIENVNKALEEF